MIACMRGNVKFIFKNKFKNKKVLCKERPKELPLQNFFRLVFSPSFETESVTAHFGKLPAQHLLTMKISTPEPWDVQTSHAVYDLDNLRVDENDPSTQFVFAEFTLKHLVAYGVCHNEISQFPPNGLQLVLGDIGL